MRFNASPTTPFRHGMEGEENNFPAITRALNILRERYQDQILQKKHTQQNEQLIDEDSFVLPQTLIITPQPQEKRPSIFTGLSQRAKSLKFKRSYPSSTKLSNPKLLMKVKALERVIRCCEEWSLKLHSIGKWRNFCHNRKEFQQNFVSRLENRFDSEIFSQKFNHQARQVCVQRYGKGRLSQRYNDWRICRFYFYSWLHFVC
jgi:hypothetical protein